MKFIAALILALSIILSSGAASAAPNWPEWRGPSHNGVAEAGSPPTVWSETQNVVWKVALPWWSGSTPVVWGDKIFLTSPEKSTPENAAEVPKPDGRNPGGPMILFLCLDRKDGHELWRRELGKGNQLHRKGNNASPSPVTDGDRVWIMTGAGNLICFDMDGKELWRRNIQDDYGKFGQMWGFASSPALWEDRLIVSVLHGFNTDDPSYLLAVDKLTGKTIWKTDRPNDAVKESPDAYNTPYLFQHDGATEVVTLAGDCVTGHDAKGGAELWRVNGINPKKGPWHRSIASVVGAGGIVVAPSSRNATVAIKAGGRGDITNSHVLWSFDKGPDVPTPVTDGKLLWIVDDGGVFDCLDLNTGKKLYEPQRIARGTYTPSLVLAGGKIYATCEGATTTVLEAGPEFKVLATNQLEDDYTLSTPVPVGDQLFIRTSTSLYCIGEKK